MRAYAVQQMAFTREARDRDRGMYSTLFVWITIFWSIQKGEHTPKRNNIIER